MEICIIIRCKILIVERYCDRLVRRMFKTRLSFRNAKVISGACHKHVELDLVASSLECSPS